MLYPLKFKPVFKDYLWGGRELLKFGKELPPGITAESWDLSCHPDGLSIISNGEYAGTLLTELIKKFGRNIIGTSLPDKDVKKFPLLVKLIDSNNDLSIQVHPDDEYANKHENGEYGKNEMWYIISAKPGAKLILGLKEDVDRMVFEKAIKENTLESYLQSVEVTAGDVVNIPAGLVHAIGKGIVLAEIQQNSNTTYRVYDYNRIGQDGKKRPLHIEKALDVINFKSKTDNVKIKGLPIKINDSFSKTFKIVNKYFAIELYDLDGIAEESSDGKKFFIYTFIKGDGEISFSDKKMIVKKGETILIPASMGKYTIKGKLHTLKSYVPDIENDVVIPLKLYGYDEKDIYNKIAGLKN